MFFLCFERAQGSRGRWNSCGWTQCVYMPALVWRQPLRHYNQRFFNFLLRWQYDKILARLQAWLSCPSSRRQPAGASQPAKIGDVVRDDVRRCARVLCVLCAWVLCSAPIRGVWAAPPAGVCLWLLLEGHADFRGRVRGESARLGLRPRSCRCGGKRRKRRVLKAALEQGRKRACAQVFAQ